MIYSIIIQSSPTQNDACYSALAFAQALLTKGHKIHRIFIYGEAAILGNSHITPGQDEPNIQADWAEFIRQNSLDAVVCIATALKRGILNQQECQRYELSSPVFDDTMELSGLGQLIEASALSDKVITFT